MRNYRLTGVLVMILAAAVASSAMAVQAGDKAPAFKLEDQFGKLWDSSALKGSVVVVIAANKDSGRAMDPWVGKLKDKYGTKIQLVGLMDLHNLPGIVRGMAKSKIKKETSEPLMLDFNGSTAKTYDVTSQHPVVVVIDKSGIARAVQKTKYTDAAFKTTTAAIDKAL